MLSDITPLILTFNEAPNIRRTLEQLSWAQEIVVVDSFSTDETLAIATTLPRTRVVHREFDSFAGQCNFGLQCARTEWVLSLDADYVLSDEFPEHAEHGAVAAPSKDKPAPVAVAIHYVAPTAVDTTFRRAVDAGCKEVVAPHDAFWGARFAMLTDPFGHRWNISAPLE